MKWGIACKRLYTSHNDHQMANLSKYRIIIGQPPFTITGCDCYVPTECSTGTPMCYDMVARSIVLAHVIFIYTTLHIGSRFLSELSEEVYY